MNRFIESLKSIIYLIREYSVTEYFKLNNKEAIKLPDFFRLSNHAFKLAQAKILNLLKEEIAHHKKINELLKIERCQKNRNNELIKQYEHEIKVSEHHELILRHLMDTIVWQIFGGKREIIARFYLEDEGRKSLEDEGFKATIKVANKINEDPLKFALITDLTEKIQVGDLLIWTLEGIEIVEVKSGEKNNIALDMLEFYNTNNLNPSDKIDSIKDENLKKQIQRIIKQKQTLIRTRNIIENDYGKYQRDDNMHVNLKESIIPQETYHSILIKLIEKSKEKEWAYDCIGAIIHVGVYRKNWRGQFGKEALRLVNNNFPVHNLLSCIGITICEPIFCKPFSSDVILDILTGDIEIYVGIDFDKLIAFGNDCGLPMRWSSSKELAKIQNASPLKNKEIFSYLNKGIVLKEDKDGKYFLGGGFLVRLLFDHLDPWIEIQNRALSLK